MGATPGRKAGVVRACVATLPTLQAAPHQFHPGEHIMRTALVFAIGLLFGGSLATIVASGAIISIALLSKPRIHNTELITQGECLTALSR